MYANFNFVIKKIVNFQFLDNILGTAEMFVVCDLACERVPNYAHFPLRLNILKTLCKKIKKQVDFYTKGEIFSSYRKLSNVIPFPSLTINNTL